MNGVVRAICICAIAGEPMREVLEVEAVASHGLTGDRYSAGEGSFNRGKQGDRQVTFMNAIFFKESGFEFRDSRRNIFVEGVELMWLIGREFQVSTARFRGIKYCDPCQRPSKLAGKTKSFRDTFLDRGGLLAEVIETGLIKIDDAVIPPSRGY